MANPAPLHPTAELLPARPWKESLREIAGAGAFLAVATYLFLAFLGGEETPEGAWRVAPVAGEQVLQHIGWGFGVNIPVLLAFYAIVIGGQLVASPSASATRRTLGAVAQMMAAAFLPALLLILAACIHDPSQAGALVVIVPATGITLFLAVQLGGFVVFDNAQKLAAAIRNRDWAQGRLQTLRARGRRPLWLVIALNTALGGAIAFSLTTVIASPKGPLWLLFLVYAMFCLGLTLVNIFGVQTLRTAQDRPSKALAWLLPISMNMIVATIALNLFIQDAGAGGIALFAVLVFCTLSALWPRRFMGRLLLNWTIQGAGTAYAARSIARRYSKACREIQELSCTTSPELPATFRERALTAFRVLRAGHPAVSETAVNPRRQ